MCILKDLIEKTPKFYPFLKLWTIGFHFNQMLFKELAILKVTTHRNYEYSNQ